MSYTKKNLETVQEALRGNKSGRLALQGDDAFSMWNEFKRPYEYLEAAGGLVLNKAGSLLFILRKGVWDLPKGKIDPGETAEEAAVREVREECGFTVLSDVRFFDNTYHIYEETRNFGTDVDQTVNGPPAKEGVCRPMLKRTHWFIMRSDDKNLKPQLEEDITELRWMSPGRFHEVIHNTYPNLVMLLEKFKGSSQ